MRVSNKERVLLILSVIAMISGAALMYRGINGLITENQAVCMRVCAGE